MSDDKKADQAGDQDSAEPTPPDTPPPPAEDTDKAKADGGQETEESAKQNAADWRNARKLSRRSRARDDAVAALLGGGRGTENVFIVDQIGYVDAGIGKAGPSVAAARYGTVPSGPIPEHTLHELVKTYVQPGNYPEIRRQLKARSVLLLRAAAGWGRTATALVLLRKSCNEGVDKLNPDTSLRAPGELGLQPNRGYLVQSLGLDEAATLGEYHFTQLSRFLDETGARMIVLVDEHTPLKERELAEYLVDGSEPPDGKALVASHFTAHLEIAGQPDKGLADYPEFTDIVTEYVGSVPHSQDLAEFAQLLGEVALGHADIDDVRRRYDKSADSAFREWFDCLADNEERAFVIALAAFDGMPLHLVTVTAGDLARRFQAVEVPDRRARVRSIFRARTHTLVSKAEAEMISSVEVTDLGSIVTEVVRFRDSTRARRVLEHVWREYPEAHQIVREWLHSLGGWPDVRVLARAGAAVGLLSLSEFDHARQLVIEQWADVEGDEQHEAVLSALQIPSMQPELQPLISRMLVEWLHPANSLARRVAAVSALGILPVMSARRALRLLRGVAAAPDAVMIIAIADTLTNLAIRGSESQVLAVLMRWTESQRPQIRVTGLTCVLQLCSHLAITVEGSAEPWPALLRLSVQDPNSPNDASYRDKIVALIARALDAAFFMPETYELIRSWVVVAQRDPTQREPLGKLLFEIATQTRDLPSMRYHLETWAKTSRKIADAVADVLSVLSKEERTVN